MFLGTRYKLCIDIVAKKLYFDYFEKYCISPYRRNNEFLMKASVGKFTPESQSLVRANSFEICFAKLRHEILMQNYLVAIMPSKIIQ